MRGLGITLGAALGWVAGSLATQLVYERAAERAYTALQLPGAQDPDEIDFSIDLNPDVPWINGENDEDDVEIILSIREWLVQNTPGLG